MSRVPRLGAALVVLAILSAGYAPGPALAADELPDLKVEFVGVPIGSNQRDVQVKVTNVSAWWADETSLRIETVSPAPANPVVIDVENLDPGQSVTFTYTLAAACNGHVVRAEISAAKNYAGVPESNLANNVVQGQACAAPGAPKPEPKPGGLFDPRLPSGPITELPAGLETRRSVPISAVAELSPRVVRDGAREFDVGSCSTRFFPGNPPLVGWWQVEDKCAFAFQTAATFDLSDLSRVPNTTVDRAVLSFQEQPYKWTDDDGNSKYVNSCVVTLGRATVDWAIRPDTNALFPNEVVENKIPFGSHEWDVTTVVGQWVSGELPAYGFVLRGHFEDLEATNSASCLSIILDMKLDVTYIRPASAP